MNREVIRTRNFASDAANFIVDHARKAVAERNEFRIALSGGNTPRPIYERRQLRRRSGGRQRSQAIGEDAAGQLDPPAGT